MNPKHYFENAQGIGILAADDDKGKVDTPIYKTPQIIDENTIALNMLGRYSY